MRQNDIPEGPSIGIQQIRTIGKTATVLVAIQKTLKEKTNPESKTGSFLRTARNALVRLTQMSCKQSRARNKYPIYF